ncbi:hypothetical protein [Massilia sp. BSC265]|uniref:hypothetical protein n=1 Tax=Massilia sp. BSC265 TaxID=1549812 RepID=UPI0004E93165|nr:hypothetical protein [Massilia sp. BSC265]KFI08200.1 hypothetical protein JN27_05200 [Massilia sp. BSC265]
MRKEGCFTTLRDLGTEGADYADVGIKRTIDEGVAPGPRLFIATKAIVASYSYGPAEKSYRPDMEIPYGAQPATGEYFQKHVRGGVPTPAMQQAHRAFQLAHRLGVTIGNGSDVGVFAHGTNAREREWMVRSECRRWRRCARRPCWRQRFSGIRRTLAS